ncbi:Clr6 histone deacetylase associated PHD protein-2 Cph2 [Rhizina undulata]
MDLDYDSCAQFLARLDADAESVNNNNCVSPIGGGIDSVLSLSPLDNRNSASPPGLSSGSATSHSPESLRFDYDVGSWNPNDPSAFFSPISDPVGLLNGQTWDTLMPQQDQQQSQQQGRVLSPLTDYIKIENDSPRSYYGGGSQQATISPSNSLIDPTTQTALEGNYSFGKENDALFDFNYGNAAGQGQGNSADAYNLWRNQPQQRDDFSPLSWQSPPQQQSPPQLQQQQRVQQQRQKQNSISQEPSSLRTSLSPSSHSRRTTSSPESRAHESHSDDNSVPRPKKRKTSTEETPSTNNLAAASTSNNGAATSGRKQQPKKTAHNMIEKRYRTNLNDKIAALRDSVPSLRVMAGTAKLGEDDEDEDLEGLTPAHKLNKATVLAKATEYIRHLEKRTKRLQDENEQLKNRLSAFEKLATMGPMNVQGQGGRGGATGGPGGGLMSRLMVGSLAGLMIANGLHEHEGGTRQLFAFPVTAFEMLGVPMSPSLVAGNHMFWIVFKLFLIFAAVVYVLVPGFFDTKQKEAKPKNNSSQHTIISPAPSLASPLEVRRKAWLTAIQSVWIPRHSFALEVAALGLKMIKLGLRKFVGWEKYALITGMTGEHEIARVKAWTIALDAQLAGGDATITHSRVLLTLLASMTLPATPGRFMLNALHIRVLFWDFGSSFEAIADRLANYYWIEARKLQQRGLSDKDESLPEHLTKLLELDPSLVLDSRIVEKAYNLAYNPEAICETPDEGMDTVTEDVSIRSPLDALAAWYSSLVLQQVFLDSLKSKSSDAIKKRIDEGLQVALRVAPPTSGTQLRALAAKAVLDSDDEGKNLRTAFKIFEEDFKSHRRIEGQSAVPRNIITPINTVVTSTTDIRVALRCAMTLALLKKGSRDEAMRLFSDLDWRRQATSSFSTSANARNNIGLLGFVACWKTLTYFIANDETWIKDSADSVDKAAAMLRIWIGDRKLRRKVGVGKDDCKKVIDFCNGLQKKVAGFVDEEGDDGYVSGGLATKGQLDGKVLNPAAEL